MDNKYGLTTEHDYSFDFVRMIALLSVIIFHAAGAYGVMGSGYWPVTDTQNFFGSAIRELFDVFIMPFFLFIAGYFALPSIRNKTFSKFFINKFNRLYVYWLFIVIILLPLGRYFSLQYQHSNINYFSYWLSSLLDFRNVSIGPLPKFNHMHFWFISLLFYIFILFGMAYKFSDKLFFKKELFKGKSNRSINIIDILVFGILAALVYYVFLLFFPGSSWVLIPQILQFKITHLPVLISFFGFGIYLSFKKSPVKDIPFNIRIWLILSILFTVLFFISGQDFFNKNDFSNTLSPLYLFIFSLIRSFLILSYLILTLLVADKFFTKKNVFIKKISVVSYEIYLVHLFFIVAFQITLLHFKMIPVSVKIFTAFFLGTIASYFFGKYTIYKYPKISATILILCFASVLIFFR